MDHRRFEGLLRTQPADRERSHASGPAGLGFRYLGPAFAAGALAKLFALVAAGVLVFSACSAAQSAAPPSTLPTQRPAQSAAPPSTSSTPNQLYSTQYSCAGVSFTPGSSVPLGPELAGDEQSRVLEATTSRLASILPDSGWGKVTPPIHDSLFVAPSSKTLATYVFVVERLSSSGWSLFAYGDCEPATPPAVAEGSYTFGDWWIGATPSPSDRTLKIWVETSYCNADFVGPSIWYSQSSITVTFWARLNPLSPPTPPAICPLESQMQPSTLTLAEPVGSRELLEGPAFAAKPVLSAGPTEPASSSS